MILEKIEVKEDLFQQIIVMVDMNMIKKKRKGGLLNVDMIIDLIIKEVVLFVQLMIRSNVSSIEKYYEDEM